jgi:hypothetical protein
MKNYKRKIIKLKALSFILKYLKIYNNYKNVIIIIIMMIKY